MKLDATLTEKISSKGNKYICIEIQLTPTYKKTVFLDKPEEELLRVIATQQAQAQQGVR